MIRRSRASHYKNSGFTLIEVLIALGILTIALGALVKGLAQNTRNAAYLQDRMIAHWVAANAVTEIRLGGDLSSPGTEEGNAIMAEREWYWTAKITETEDEGIWRIELAVGEDDDTEDRSLMGTLVSYLGKPLEMDGNGGAGP